MQKWSAYILALSICTALSTYADQNADIIKKLQKQIRQQQMKIDSLTSRLDQYESSHPVSMNLPEKTSIKTDLEQRITQLEQQAEILNKEITEKTNRIFARQNKMAWAEQIKLNADARIRFEHNKKGNQSDENRMRFRARAGINANFTDELYAGIRLATGSDDRSTSVNQDFTNWGSKKDVWIDLAYIGYMPEYVKGLNLSIGKIKKPWFEIEPMLWDSDVNPEGISAIYDFNAGPLDIRAHGGYFIMSERDHDDITLTSLQLSCKMNITEEMAMCVGGTAFLYNNIDDAKIPGSPDRNRYNGNSFTTDGIDFYYATGFQIGQLFSDVTIQTKPATFTIYGELSKNYDAVDSEDTAWLTGISIKRKKASIKYNYRHMDNNSTVAFFTDSNFGSSSIAKGHKISGKYELTKNFWFAFTCNLAECWNGIEENTFLFDVTTKF